MDFTKLYESSEMYTGIRFTDEVRAFYPALAGPVRVGLEASGYSQWYEEMLEGLGIELWVGDPGWIRNAAPRKQKTDRNDARPLLQLLEVKRFPRICASC